MTLQPPKLDGADLIRQLVADKNDQGLVVNVEFIDIAEQTDSNINSVNARSDEEEIAVQISSELKTSKFNTEAMIGPLEDTNNLFSTTIEERYEAYAAHVPANRTRRRSFFADLHGRSTRILGLVRCSLQALVFRTTESRTLWSGYEALAAAGGVLDTLFRVDPLAAL